MEKEGIIRILYDLGMVGDYTDDETARCSATTIGHIYGTLPLPNYCKSEVISFLKRIVQTSESKNGIHPFGAIVSLALC
jgi:hypothetical protein